MKCETAFEFFCRWDPNIAVGFIAFIFSSCNKDKGTITITYNKGTAIYANIDEIRAIPLVSAPRVIENAGKIFMNEEMVLIGEKGKGIHVYNNSNPNNPINIS